MDKREFDPIRGTFPKAKDIMCKDCFYRDRTTVVLDGEKKAVGVTKGFCAKFPPPPDSAGKPLGVLFMGEKCPEYMKDGGANG